jgi:hypothetical protein
MELLEFEEKYSGNNLHRLIKYVIKFGSYHLVAPSHIQAHWLTVADADTLIALSAGVVMSIFTLHLMFCAKAEKTETHEETPAETE